MGGEPHRAGELSCGGWRAHLGAIEDALLQVAAVCHLADDAAQSIHLMHKLRLGGPAHRRIAWLHTYNDIKFNASQSCMQ